MWIRSRIASGVSAATSTRTRRLFFLLCVFIFVYLAWTSFPYRPGGLPNSCLDIALHQFIAAERRGETSITRISSLVRRSPAAVLGNGHIGIDLSQESLLFGYNGLEWLEARYSPQLSVSLEDSLLTANALVFEYKEAIFHFIYSRRVDSGCVQIRHSVQVHRNTTSLIVQDMLVQNSAPRPVNVEFKHMSTSSWSGASTSRQDLKASLRTSVSSQYILASGAIPATATTPAVVAAVASVAGPVDAIEVADNKVFKAQFLSIVHYEVGSNLSSTGSDVKTLSTPNSMVAAVLLALEKQLAITDHEALVQRSMLHQTQWADLWKTIPRVLSKSHPSTPSNAEIYASLFHLWSITPSSKEVQGVDVVQHHDKECFTGSPTMHTTSLWLVPHRLSAIHSLVANWNRVLRNGFCDFHLDRGVQLLGQIATLSFLGFRHVPSNKCLDLALNPALVQADVFVHNIMFAGHLLSFNIELVHGVAQTMRLTAEPLDQTLPAPPLYVCPASCTGKPKLIGMTEVRLPVVPTRPVTPLLYISAHLDQLTFIQNHSRELQTYHLPGESHRHDWGVHTVSTRVWVLLGFLLATFHLFLLHIICKEYCPDFICTSATVRRMLPRRVLETFGCLRSTD